MEYRLSSGQVIDTARDLSFEERNFLQKMMIRAHLREKAPAFRRRWLNPDSPVWKGEKTLSQPGPAVKILLDLESKLPPGGE